MLCSGTYRSISTHLENSLAGFSSQRLRAGDHAICTMNDTAAAWELDELRILSRVDSLRIETHFEKVVKETRTANSNVVGRTDEGAGNSFMSRHEDKRNIYAVICNIPNRSDERTRADFVIISSVLDSSLAHDAMPLACFGAVGDSTSCPRLIWAGRVRKGDERSKSDFWCPRLIMMRASQESCSLRVDWNTLDARTNSQFIDLYI